MNVTLIDGSRVDSWSEAWRHECEARSILAMPSKHQRQDFLAGIEKYRGAAAAEKLRAKVLQVWEHERSKNGRE